MFFYQMCVSIQTLQQLLLCYFSPSTACYTDAYIVTIVLGDLCDNIGLVGVSAKWSYVTASPSHHDKAIPVLSPLLFMHVSHPYIPLFKIRRIFDFLVIEETVPYVRGEMQFVENHSRDLNQFSSSYYVCFFLNLATTPLVVLFQP